MPTAVPGPSSSLPGDKEPQNSGKTKFLKFKTKQNKPADFHSPKQFSAGFFGDCLRQGLSEASVSLIWAAEMRPSLPLGSLRPPAGSPGVRGLKCLVPESFSPGSLLKVSFWVHILSVESGLPTALSGGTGQTHSHCYRPFSGSVAPSFCVGDGGTLASLWLQPLLSFKLHSRGPQSQTQHSSPWDNPGGA